MVTTETILELAEANRIQAMEIIRETGIIEAWESIGAEPNLVGSLRNGLFMKHRDIDFHIYSSPVDVADSFRAVARIAVHPSVSRVTCTNLLHTEEKCLEWHAWYTGADRQEWQLDMIHILRGSRYDGYMERVADRIKEVITPETRETVLRLKYQAPETESIPGIVYYVAVLRDGVRTWDEFTHWRKENPCDGVLEWIP